MTEHYTLESLTEMWTTFYKEHGYVPALLDAASQYPEVQSVTIPHLDISKYSVELAEHLLERPRASLMGAERAAQNMLPPGQRVPLRIFIVDLPEDHVRRPVDLRAVDVGKLICVKALVMKCNKPTLHYTTAVFQCMRCGAIHHMEQDRPGKLKEPIECYKENGGCQRAAGSTKFRVLTHPSDLPYPFPSSEALGNGKVAFSETTDEQWIDIQDIPDDLGDDELPTDYKARLGATHLVQQVMPGDRAMLYGMLLTNNEKNLVSPEMYLDISHLENLTRDAVVVTDDDVENIRAMISQCENPLQEILLPSLAPHVCGLDHVKEGILCQLFGGISEMTPDKVLRAALHIMVIGDPGTGKSQLLKYVPKLVPRGTYTNADMASKAGLAVAVEKGEGGGWRAVPGPLVRSHRSICCVDELNKMDADEISTLNESMEQGTVTVTKAARGTFMAETAILAAANPKEGGRYYGDFRESVDISEATLSRFALIYILKDTRDKDEMLQRMMRPYYGLGERLEGAVLDPKTFAKYIMLARSLRPRFTEAAAQLVEAHHVFLRSGDESTWSNRVLEDLYRLSVAVARTRLSEEVTRDDALSAIRIHTAGAWGEVHGTGARFEVEHVTVAAPQKQRMKVLLEAIRELVDAEGSAEVNMLITRARDKGVPPERFQEDLQRLLDDGVVYEEKTGVYGVV